MRKVLEKPAFAEERALLAGFFRLDDSSARSVMAQVGANRRFGRIIR
jgi:hypothetical protein